MPVVPKADGLRTVSDRLRVTYAHGQDGLASIVERVSVSRAKRAGHGRCSPKAASSRIAGDGGAASKATTILRGRGSVIWAVVDNSLKKSSRGLRKP